VRIPGSNPAGHGYSSFVIGPCCVSSGLWDGPITRPEESTGCVCEREREI